MLLCISYIGHNRSLVGRFCWILRIVLCRWCMGLLHLSSLVIALFLASLSTIHIILSLPNTQFENFVLLFSLSYVIYDFFACVYFRLADGGLVLHHSLCVLGYSSALIQGYGAIDSIGGLFVAEVSNFPMHLRVIFRNFGLRYTRVYETS